MLPSAHSSVSVPRMMGTIRKQLVLGVLIGCLLGPSTNREFAAAPQSVLTDAVLVRGDIRPTTLRLSDLQTMGSVTETWTHHGKSHQVVGVPLLTVLARCGWTPGPSGKSVAPAQKHSGHRFVAIATAADGYQAVFSTGELAEESTRALIVWSVDGALLTPESGPLRLIVFTDHGLSRSLYQLRSIDVIDAAKLRKQSL